MTTRQDATLIDVLIDGFEKNEILGGFHLRYLPLADESDAIRKFRALVDEARRWKGVPTRQVVGDDRRLAAWPDLEIRQAARGVVVRVRAPRFESWWQESGTWAGDPMAAVHDWLAQDREP